MSRHDEPHGRDARATGVAPIDPSGLANLLWHWTTRARSRYILSETALDAIVEDAQGSPGQITQTIRHLRVIQKSLQPPA